MNRYSINQIASVITEDPDIIVELDAAMNPSMNRSPITDPATIVASTPTDIKPEINKPLTAIEVEKQAEITGEEPDQEMVNQIRDQEKIQQQMDLERQRLLEPQMNRLRGSMDTLGTGITQGAAASRAGNDTFSNLDQQMDQINSIVGDLEKQF